MRLRLLLPLLTFLAACAGDPVPPPEGPAAAAGPPPAPLGFDTFTYRDSVALRRGGPWFTYDLRTLRATGGDPALRTRINDTLAHYLLGFAWPADSSFARGVRYAAQTAFDDYLAQPVDEGLLEESDVPYRRDEVRSTELLYRTDSLLVLAYHLYAYTGGAHGNHYTALLPFAVYPPRRLAYADLFRPDARAELSRLLTEQAREQDVALYVDTVPVTPNVAPLPAGVRFLYDPYAIAPYASGEVAIDLPYARIQGLLRPGVRKLLPGGRAGSSSEAGEAGVGPGELSSE